MAEELLNPGEKIVPTETNCGNCRYFFGEVHEERCRRFPPVKNPVIDGKIYDFPYVYQYDWCGEWKWLKK